MKNKKLILAVIALVVLVAVMVTVFVLTKPETQQGAKAFTVTVVHKNGSTKEFSYRTDGEYLGPVLVEKGLIEGSEGPYGLTIDAVDGETADWEKDNAYWALYVGEEYAVTGIDTTPVYDGSTFKLIYEGM